MADQRLVFIGLSGLAGSGKTATANALAPGGVYLFGEFGDGWPEHIYNQYILAAPLYNMVGIKRMTQGVDWKDRILYGLHDELSELMGRSMGYDDFAALVHRVADEPAGGEYDAKPRKFMVDVGDWVREHYKDCFVDLVIRKARIEQSDVDALYQREEIDPPIFFAVIPDVRYPNEVKRLREAGQLVLVKLNVSFDTANQRILERDEVAMDPEIWEHPTEAGFPDEDCDLILNTDELSVQEVAGEIKEFILPGYAQEVEDRLEAQRISREAVALQREATNG